MPKDYSRQEVLTIIQNEAKERGIPKDDFLRFAYIETGGKFDEQASRGERGAKGLFQFVPSTAAQYGIAGRELDAVANTDAAARLYLDNQRDLTRHHDRTSQPYLSGQNTPSGLDMYMAHQQGSAGYHSIQAGIATGSFTRSDTRPHILNNVSARDIREHTGLTMEQFGKLSDKQLGENFVKYWDAKYRNISIPEVGVQPLSAGSRPQSQPSQSGPQQNTSPMADGQLKQGEHGPEIQRLQHRLNTLGYGRADGTPLVENGKFGPNTEAAVIKFQKEHGLQGLGVVGPKTEAALVAAERARTQGGQNPQAQTQTAPQTGQGKGGIVLNAAYDMTLKYDNVKYGFGSKNLATGKVDCSGWVSQLQNATMQEINRESGKTIFSGKDFFDKNNQAAADIIKDSVNTTGTLIRSPLTKSLLKDGMIIGEDNGEKGWDKGRYKGIDHITMVVKDPKSGQLMISQSRGGEGVELTTVDKYLQSKQSRGVALFATDPLAKARPLIEGKQQTQGGAQAAKPVGAMDDGVLKSGEKGKDVRSLQESLSQLGYKSIDGSPLKPDGDFGKNTKAAIEAFQKSNGMPATGVADAATLVKVGQQVQSKATVQADQPGQTPVAPTSKTETTPPTASAQTEKEKPAAPAQTPEQSDKPLISNANHPDNKLYQQAVSNLEQLGPSGGFASRDALEKAAAAVAVDAKATGLKSIDHISRTNAPSGQVFLVAVQGDPTSPAAKNSFIDYGQAVNQTVAQSTRMAEDKAAVQMAEQPQQQGPNRVAATR